MVHGSGFKFQEKGFTLLELLLVIGMIVTLAAIATGTYIKVVRDIELQDTTAQVAFDLQNARSRAMTGDDNLLWGIHVVNTTNDYYELFQTASNYAAGTVKETRYLPGTIAFTIPVGSATKDILFNKIFGTTTADTVTIASSNNTRTVAVSANGKVDIVSNNDLSAYWPLEDGSGTSTIDASGAQASTNGTLAGGATWQTSSCASGYCINFDGINGDVTTADRDDFSPSVNDLTVAFWAKVPSAATALGNGACGSTGRYMVAKGNISRWEWGFENDNNSLLCFDLWQLNGNPHAEISSARTMNDNVWHHYAAVVDYLNRTALYVDGSEVASTTTFTGTSGNETQAVQLGRRGDGNYFSGLLDDVRFYSRALTATEVQVLYTTGK